jgi:hypothetical protein
MHEAAIPGNAMTSPWTLEPVATRLSSRLWTLVPLLLALGIIAVMPSADSLWIDEAQTAKYAREPTLEAWADRLVADTASESQMPLAMLISWAAGQTLGTGEWQLRAINILWGAIAVVIMWRIGQRLRIPGLELVLAVHPFLWFYVNEARPYAFQIVGGACLLLCAITCIQREGRGADWAWYWTAAAVGLAGSSLLGIIPVLVVSGILLVLIVRNGWALTRQSYVAIATGIVVLIPLGGYYVWTLMKGAGGARVWTVGLGNIAYALYELGGFAGLGPPRQELRILARSGELFSAGFEFLPQIAAILFLAACYLMLLSSSFFVPREAARRRLIVPMVVVPALSIGLLATAAGLAGFPFWGRHLAPVVPFVVALVGAATFWNTRPAARLTFFVIVALWLTSGLSLRFSAEHAKDDYRTAAAIARVAAGAGQTVWWAADHAGARYYQLRLSEGGLTGFPGLRVIHNRPDQEQVSAALPDMVILSKPDIFDPEGRLQQMLHRHGYVVSRQLQAFTVWQKPGAVLH